MDTGEQYIKMCRGIKDIQDSWVIEVGDFVCAKKLDHFTKVILDKFFPPEPPICVIDADMVLERGRPYLRSVFLWLPRQDQLQELSGRNYGDFYKFWLQNGGKDEYIGVISMEQLWLAFAMKEKYDKAWDGEDWVLGKV